MYNTQCQYLHVVWFMPGRRHRCHLYCIPPIRKVQCYRQDTVYGCRRSGKKTQQLWTLYPTCDLVDSLKSCRREVAGAHRAVRIRQKQSTCWAYPEGRVQYESKVSPMQPPVNHATGSPLLRVSYRISLGKPVCRWLVALLTRYNFNPSTDK